MISATPSRREIPRTDRPAVVAVDRIVESGAAARGLSLSTGERARLHRYLTLALDWGGRLRLTGARTPEQTARILVVDAMDVLPFVPDCGAVADLGSGAGVPGVVVAVLRPRVHVVFVEATRRKADFLEVVARDLALNAEVVWGRVEALGRAPAHRERYDAVTARALADLRVLAEYALPLLRIGGIAVFPKGPSAAVEVASAARALELLGGRAEIQGPDSSHTSPVVLVHKISQTPATYPRRPGIPQKRPLK